MRSWRQALLLAVCATPSPAAPIAALPMPEGVAATAPAFAALQPAVSGYNTWIGGYPTRLKDEAQRAEVYQRWSETVRQARAFHAREGDTIEALWALTTLHRMGHNMDVQGCAAEAQKFLELGLRKYADSIPLNFEAAYFYLTVDAKFAPQGEAALRRLRRLKNTDQDPEIERGMIFAYLYQNRIDDAKAQIARCLAFMPDNKTVLQLRETLKTPLLERPVPPHSVAAQ